MPSNSEIPRNGEGEGRSVCPALLEEIREIHQYARLEFQLLVAWYTFFLTIMTGATAWAFTACLDDKKVVIAWAPFCLTGAFYLVQIVCAMWIVVFTVPQDMSRAKKRVAEIYRDGDGALPPQSPIPAAFWSACLVMAIVFVLNAFLIVAAAAYTVTRFLLKV